VHYAKFGLCTNPLPGRWLAFIIIISLSAPCAADHQTEFPKTTESLKQRYIDEVVAHQHYGAYAKKAEEEGYPNFAHLFRSLAASEAVHARNFKRLLTELGAEIPEPPVTGLQVAGTRDNIGRATTVETNEIDNEYPGILESIADENHQEAIENITYAWQAEKQHRELISKIHKAAKSWFSLLVERIEGKPSHYYVCQICGSTLTELPGNQCPICGHDVSNYQEVPGFPGVRKPKDKPYRPF
jgi:rubrerythrin